LHGNLPAHVWVGRMPVRPLARVLGGSIAAAAASPDDT
jgi:hypothetical protein